MTIHDKHAFEDAQIMARIALRSTDELWREACWNSAMLALEVAYKGKK